MTVLSKSHFIECQKFVKICLKPDFFPKLIMQQHEPKFNNVALF